MVGEESRGAVSGGALRVLLVGGFEVLQQGAGGVGLGLGDFGDVGEEEEEGLAHVRVPAFGGDEVGGVNVGS